MLPFPSLLSPVTPLLSSERYLFNCAYMLPWEPTMPRMSVLDSSRFQLQRCSSSSHSPLDLRPKRKSCST